MISLRRALWPSVLACLLSAAAPLASHGLTRRAPPLVRPVAPGPSPAAASPAEDLVVTMRDHESLPVALARGGLGAQEAGEAAGALSDEFDTVNPHPGLALALRRLTAQAAAPGRRLVSLTLTPRQDVSLRLWRDARGVLRVERTDDPVIPVRTLVEGQVDGSLYLSLVGKGMEPAMAARVEGLFGRRLDLGRDIESGDRFRLVFEQRRHVDGQPLAPPDLIYADLAARSGPTRLYRSAPDGAGDADYTDGDPGARPAPFLLRTPVAGARVTSGFGMRLHPILGFTRMHQGVDFAAPAGSPVLAAADGVVEEARWAGGYGRWLKIRHAAGLETGYGHLSAWAVAAGAHVRQGQVVAYVGSSGLATGPHLHYEVFDAGRRIDPQSGELSRIQAKAGGADPAFRARKADIDAMVASLDAACAPAGRPAAPAGACAAS
jgi:murein DD-endopeptidase MepM/ murein hydrolase activator NlpD